MSDFEIGSGNVFADLGLPDPDLLLAKAELGRQISKALRTRRLGPKGAARLLEADAEEVDALLRGSPTRLTLDQLARFLTRLGFDVDIAVRSSRRKKGRIAVV